MLQLLQLKFLFTFKGMPFILKLLASIMFGQAVQYVPHFFIPLLCLLGQGVSCHATPLDSVVFKRQLIRGLLNTSLIPLLVINRQCFPVDYQWVVAGGHMLLKTGPPFFAFLFTFLRAATLGTFIALHMAESIKLFIVSC